MKKFNISIISALCAIIFTGFAFVSCNDDDPATLSVQPESLSFTADAKTTTIAVLSANTEWTVISSDPSWCTVLPTTGVGNVNVTVSVLKNPSLNPRTATITVSSGSLSGTVAVTQLGEAKTLTVSQPAVLFGATDVSKTVTITSNIPWTAAVTDLQPAGNWCTVDPLSGTTSGTLTITTTNNATSNAWTAKVTITSELGTKTIDITKSGIPTSNTEKDSLALVALYNATNGSAWTNGWTLTDPMDTWAGIVCGTVGNELRVVRIELWSNNLTGSLPAEIGNLDVLTRFAVQGNAITGNLPAEIGNMSALEELMMAENQLDGVIPESIGQLVNLETCWVDKNNFTGTLPVAFSNLINLTQFTMHGNRLSGTIPQAVKDMPNWSVVSGGLCPQQAGYVLDVCP